MSEFEIKLSITDGVGILNWADSTDPESLEKAVSAVSDDALLGHELRRLEVSLLAGDRMARRALLRAGFHLEGIRRQALRIGEDEFNDVAMFSRLASDSAYGSAAHSAVMNSVLPRKRVIAHVLFRNPEGQVLYCKTTFKKDWELPGGVVEPNEAPARGASREVLEELGVRLPIGRLLVADWMPPYLGWEDALELIFDGGVIDPAEVDLVPDQHEIAAVHWVSVEEATEHLIPLAADRLRLIDALGPNETLYTESGKRV